MRAVAQKRTDVIACGLSAACMVHCLFLPVLASLMPVLGAAVDAEWVHWVFVALAAPLAIFTFSKPRASWALRTLAALGILLLIAGASEFPSHEWETANSVAGALLLAAAHILNAIGLFHRTPALPK